MNVQLVKIGQGWGKVEGEKRCSLEMSERIPRGIMNRYRI